jgi:S-methylmethionine-dependent homocysteine/selenocysteine methylase
MKYRHHLPQLVGGLFVTDGGIETTLIFNEGLDLPYFAAFDLLRTEEGANALQKYFRTYAELAKQHQLGFILESATWRASADWGAKLGYSEESLAEANRQAIRMLADLRKEYERDIAAIVISGCVGPRGDGYEPSNRMSVEDAERYHRPQISTFRKTEADMVTAITMNYVEEAIGITRAAMREAMPVVISFTVETDGRLPSGESLAEAIGAVDQATGYYPAYYMINCAHPVHFAEKLVGAPWLERIRGLRANASTKSHAELNESAELDIGDPVDLGIRHAELVERLDHLNVFGGCCGTDDRHVDAICTAVVNSRLTAV